MMYNLTDINTVKGLLSERGIVLTKARGQNFLIDSAICPKMAALTGATKQDSIIEIGPGIGVLTEQLAKISKKVVSVELDRGLLPILDKTLAEYDNISILNQDALKTDFNRLIETELEGNVYLCANLPYNITTPILMHFLENKVKIKKAVVMVQKEFAERLCSPVGSRQSGALTVACAYYAKTERLFSVKSGSFFPAPKVDSAVISITPYEHPPIEVKDEKLFFKIIKAGFIQRRKTLQNALLSGMGLEKEKTASVLCKLDLSPTIRIEAMTLQQLADFSNEICDYVN